MTRARVALDGELDLRDTDPAVARAVWWACITELRALKPGNVSVYAGGHGMSVDHFVAIARLVAPMLAHPGSPVGERVIHSVRATREHVGCNTNLGIVLLAAPLAHAALTRDGDAGLRKRLAEVLRGLTVDDAAAVFAAIRLAEPAGLGTSERHDVHDPPRAPLVEIMRSAAPRDRIAYQYTTEFADVFETGVPLFDALQSRYGSPEWAAVGVYLTFLANIPDTHIARKHGTDAAARVCARAAPLLARFRKHDDPESAREALLRFDDALKQSALNPGTSADLTVASLLAWRLGSLDGLGRIHA